MPWCTQNYFLTYSQLTTPVLLLFNNMLVGTKSVRVLLETLHSALEGEAHDCNSARVRWPREVMSNSV